MRADSAEALASVYNYYISQCALGTSQCNAARTFGDIVYGAIFGNPALTAGGYYSDSHFVNQELSNNSLGSFKWTGFFFGMTNSRIWPALRQLYTATSIGSFLAPKISVGTGVTIK